MISTVSALALSCDALFGFLGMRRERPRERVGAGAPQLLAATETLRIDEPLRCNVTCLSGLLWLTHDGDPKDLILRPGEQYRATRRSTLLVHALQDSRLALMRSD